MMWANIAGTTLVVIIMILYEWPKLKPNQKKEKVAFIVLAAMGWVLGTLLAVFPSMPGPTQLVDAVFKPFVQFLPK